jgi:hypothetical protein
MISWKACSIDPQQFTSQTFQSNPECPIDSQQFTSQTFQSNSETFIGTQGQCLFVQLVARNQPLQSRVLENQLFHGPLDKLLNTHTFEAGAPFGSPSTL